jgi:hypothetical protein
MSEETIVKQTYRVVAWLVAVGVLVQAAAVSFGWFDAISGLETGLVIDESYEGNAGHAIHGIVGFYGIPVLALVLLIVSFLAAKQVPGARTWAGIIFGLVILQVALAIFAFAVAPVIGALHGANALLILAAAVRAAMLARTGSSAEPASVPRQRSESGAPSESSLPVQ